MSREFWHNKSGFNKLPQTWDSWDGLPWSSPLSTARARAAQSRKMYCTYEGFALVSSSLSSLVSSSLAESLLLLASRMIAFPIALRLFCLSSSATPSAATAVSELPATPSSWSTSTTQSVLSVLLIRITGILVSDHADATESSRSRWECVEGDVTWAGSLGGATAGGCGWRRARWRASTVCDMVAVGRPALEEGLAGASSGRESGCSASVPSPSASGSAAPAPLSSSEVAEDFLRACFRRRVNSSAKREILDRLLNLNYRDLRISGSTNGDMIDSKKLI